MLEYVFTDVSSGILLCASANFWGLLELYGKWECVVIFLLHKIITNSSEIHKTTQFPHKFPRLEVEKSLNWQLRNNLWFDCVCLPFPPLKVEIKKAEPRDANKVQDESGQWGTHPDNQWGMPVGPPMPGLNNVSGILSVDYSFIFEPLNNGHLLYL